MFIYFELLLIYIVKLILQSPTNAKIKRIIKFWAKGRNMYLSVNIFWFELTRSDMRQQLIIHKVKYSRNEQIWIETLITHTISLNFKQPPRYKQSAFMVMHTHLGSYECSRTQVFHKRRLHLYTHIGDSIKSILNRPL